MLSDYRKENGSGQMGTPLVLTSGRIVATLRIRMKTVPISCHQVSGFTRFFICSLHIQHLQGKIRNSTNISKTILLNQGQLQIWTEHSTLMFEKLKQVEKSRNHLNII